MASGKPSIERRTRTLEKLPGDCGVRIFGEKLLHARHKRRKNDRKKKNRVVPREE